MLLFAFITIGCDKDDEDVIDFSRAHNKKWQRTLNLTDPAWTFPVTDKTYTDLQDFTKEMFPCAVDDYSVYYANGTTEAFQNTQCCDPNQPDKSPIGTYTFVNATDSLLLVVPFEVPGQQPTTLTVRCKVLELTNDKMVLRYNQTLPFTNTRHTNTDTYRAIP